MVSGSDPERQPVGCLHEAGVGQASQAGVKDLRPESIDNVVQPL